MLNQSICYRVIYHFLFTITFIIFTVTFLVIIRFHTYKTIYLSNQ